MRIYTKLMRIYTKYIRIYNSSDALIGMYTKYQVMYSKWMGIGLCFAKQMFQMGDFQRSTSIVLRKKYNI